MRWDDPISAQRNAEETTNHVWQGRVARNLTAACCCEGSKVSVCRLGEASLVPRCPSPLVPTCPALLPYPISLNESVIVKSNQPDTTHFSSSCTGPGGPQCSKEFSTYYDTSREIREDTTESHSQVHNRTKKSFASSISGSGVELLVMKSMWEWKVINLGQFVLLLPRRGTWTWSHWEKKWIMLPIKRKIWRQTWKKPQRISRRAARCSCDDVSPWFSMARHRWATAGAWPLKLDSHLAVWSKGSEAGVEWAQNGWVSQVAGARCENPVGAIWGVTFYVNWFCFGCGFKGCPLSLSPYSPSPEAFREIWVPRKHGVLTTRHGDLPTKTWNKTSRRFSCEAYAMSLHMPRDQVFGQ